MTDWTLIAYIALPIIGVMLTAVGVFGLCWWITERELNND